VGTTAIHGMRSNKRHATTDAAMRDREPQRRPHGQSGCDAGHGLDRNAALAQPGHFFTAATKNESIASLDACDRSALAGIASHQAKNEFLGRGATAASLADRDDAGAGRCELAHSGAYEIVDQP